MGEDLEWSGGGEEAGEEERGREDTLNREDWEEEEGRRSGGRSGVGIDKIMRAELRRRAATFIILTPRVWKWNKKD